MNIFSVMSAFDPRPPEFDLYHSARGDLAVHFVCLVSGEKFVVLFQEPDAPFETGSVQEQIPEKDFETRFVNGKSPADWIRSAQE